MNRIAWLLPLFLGCAGTPPAAPEATFGAPLSNASPVELATVLASPQAFEGKTVKLQGKVNTVCQKKGCWMTLSEKPDGPRVRVTFKDYGFFVPKDLPGRRVLAEGTFEVKTLPQAQAQHYAEDEAAAGGKPRPVAGDEVEMSLVASGVALLR
jgi:hypothetical protein